MKQIKPYRTLKEWRTALGLNQRDAALLLGMSQGLYSKIELGQSRPRPQRGKAVADKTGVPFETVMGVA